MADDDRATSLLKHISAPLECGEKQSFYKMLEIMQVHGNLHAQQLGENIKAFVRGDLAVVSKDNRAKVAIPAEGM